MRFLGGKNRKEFEEMAEKDEYIEEAYGEDEHSGGKISGGDSRVPWN